VAIGPHLTGDDLPSVVPEFPTVGFPLEHLASLGWVRDILDSGLSRFLAWLGLRSLHLSTTMCEERDTAEEAVTCETFSDEGDLPGGVEADAVVLPAEFPVEPWRR
jgi:hypothetical protein